MCLKEVKIKSVEEMTGLAARVGEDLAAGDFILLTGELGAGKTTFVQGLAKALGVVERVASPTFTVVGEYETDQKNIKKLVHVDLYRLPHGAVEQDIAVVGVLEENSKDRVTAIEWADRLSGPVSGRVWQIKFKHGKALEERVISIKWPRNKN